MRRMVAVPAVSKLGTVPPLLAGPEQLSRR